MHRILIADDDASLRLLVAATLASEEYEIIEASAGTSALELVRSQRPSLALLDVNMPGLDGIEVCRRIKSDPDLAQTIVVMLTNATTEAEQAAGIAAGAHQYLTKPFSPIELLEVIDSALS